MYYVVNSSSVTRGNSAISVNYVIKGSNLNVTLDGFGNRVGDVFTIIPSMNTTIIITQFNNISDLIDLSAFASQCQYDTLLITRGSVIITLSSTNQVIKLLNLSPADVSERNFQFASVTYDATRNKKISTTVIVISAVVSAFVCVLVVMQFVSVVWRLRDVKKKKVKVEVALHSVTFPNSLLERLNDNNTVEEEEEEEAGSSGSDDESQCAETKTDATEKEARTKNRTISDQIGSEPDCLSEGGGSLNISSHDVDSLWDLNSEQMSEFTVTDDGSYDLFW
jgi:hypothetical protein